MITIGIDPSINSTGIYIKILKGKVLYKEYFGIIMPISNVTKKEQNLKIKGFERITYEKNDVSKNKKTNNSLYELSCLV